MQKQMGIELNSTKLNMKEISEDVNIWEWVFSLVVRMLGSSIRVLGLSPGLAPEPSFLLIQTLGSSCDGSENWISATHMGDLECVSSFWLWQYLLWVFEKWTCVWELSACLAVSLPPSVSLLDLPHRWQEPNYLSHHCCIPGTRSPGSWNLEPESAGSQIPVLQYGVWPS